MLSNCRSYRVTFTQNINTNRIRAECDNRTKAHHLSPAGKLLHNRWDRSLISFINYTCASVLLWGGLSLLHCWLESSQHCSTSLPAHEFMSTGRRNTSQLPASGVLGGGMGNNDVCAKQLAGFCNPVCWMWSYQLQASNTVGALNVVSHKNFPAPHIYFLFATHVELRVGLTETITCRQSKSHSFDLS